MQQSFTILLRLFNSKKLCHFIHFINKYKNYIIPSHIVLTGIIMKMVHNYVISLIIINQLYCLIKVLI